MKLFIFIMIAYGFCNILIFGSIFKKWRDFLNTISPNFFGVLFSCFICLPFWAGFLGSWLIYSPSIDYGIVTEGINFFNIFTIPKVVISAFLDGCLTSGAVWLIHSTQEAIERHFSLPNNDDEPKA
jgi:hypothetical protein